MRRRAEGQAALLATLGQLELALADRLELIGPIPGGRRTHLLERYIDGRSWADIGQRLGDAERSVFMRHKLALVNVEGLLLGKRDLRAVT